MLRRFGEIRGARVRAIDGEIGKVEDLYFDDVDWAVRYFVADTGNWLPGREVVISPSSVRQFDSRQSRLVVELTRSQIEKSPSVPSGRLLDRQREVEVIGYFNWPSYWAPPIVRAQTATAVVERETHLRRAGAVRDFAIQARNGELGHVEDFVLDDIDWRIRYLIIDTRNWWPGKQVLVAPDWVDQIDWEHSSVHIDLSREEIKDSPEYRPGEPIDQQYERLLWSHYGREFH